jgi:Sec7-like guanine-nucleotide exchange factor
MLFLTYCLRPLLKERKLEQAVTSFGKLFQSVTAADRKHKLSHLRFITLCSSLLDSVAREHRSCEMASSLQAQKRSGAALMRLKIADVFVCSTCNLKSHSPVLSNTPTSRQASCLFKMKRADLFSRPLI